MQLSDQQEQAVSFGLRRGEKWWQRLPQVTAPKAPDWCRDAHINWMDGWGNFPELQLRLNYDPLERSGICAANPDDLKPMWHQPKPGVFCASYEGMGSVHYHSGKISKQVRKIIVGSKEPEPEPGVIFYGKLPIYEEREIFCTSQQDGYAGRSFLIRMAEDEGELSNQLLELRGPWHGGSPTGYVEVHCRLATAERDARDREWRGRKSMAHLGPDRCKWWNLGGFTFGWYVGEVTLRNIFAVYMPEIEWAKVDHGNWLRLEPIDPRTNCPKGFKPEQEIKA